MTRSVALRWMLVALLALGQAATAGLAEDETASEPVIQKVIRLKHISANQAHAVVSPLLPETQFSVVPELGILSVRGRESAIREIERVLSEVDLPQPETAVRGDRNVMFTGYLVGASDAQSDQIPEQVREAITELKRHFPYRSYNLLETFAIRAQVRSRAELSGLTATTPGQPAMRYQIEIEVGDVSETGTKKTVRIMDLRSGWRLPIETKPETFVYEEPEMRTRLDVPEGVTVVVGKSGAVGAYRGIFLLLKAEVVDP